MRRNAPNKTVKRDELPRFSKHRCYGCGKRIEIRGTQKEGEVKICFECRCEKIAWQRFAKAEITTAKRRGLPPASIFACQDCGGNAQVWDHRDYRKPLHVDAVCVACNLKRGPGLWKKPPKKLGPKIPQPSAIVASRLGGEQGGTAASPIGLHAEPRP